MNTWEFIYSKLSRQINVALLYVLESKGSSPGRQGFNMAVAADGEIHGTIGGGIMEHKFVEMARDRLLQESNQSSIHPQLHNKEGKNQSGMICSGEQEIFYYQVNVNDLPSIRKLIASLANFKNGSLELSLNGIQFSEAVPLQDFTFTRIANDFIFMEKTGLKNVLHIIGGGHCAFALSKIMRDLDFYITVYDDRKNLNTILENNAAHKIVQLNTYNELKDLVAAGPNVYVVIMTFGYRTDDIALRALINKEFRYLGMLGSKNKISNMMKAYQEENISTDLLVKVFAPVGVKINSQTAAEIAISIAAEIIGIKNSERQ